MKTDSTKYDAFVKSPSVPPRRDYCAVSFTTFYEFIKYGGLNGLANDLEIIAPVFRPGLLVTPGISGSLLPVTDRSDPLFRNTQSHQELLGGMGSSFA
jgi:hypothetical protein